jgi:hypothetical protein
MSLINKALKRAQQAQQENPPATPPLEFRPIEPGQQHRRHTLLLVGLAVVVAAILGLSVLLVRVLVQSNSNALPVAARVIEPPLAPLAAVASNSLGTPNVSTATSAGMAPNAEPTTNGAVHAAAAAVPPPAPMKLQGIFFNPRSPSAVVNGQSVYLGDRVDGFRVMGISPVAVTLVSATATNVLSLSGR